MAVFGLKYWAEMRSKYQGIYFGRHTGRAMECADL